MFVVYKSYMVGWVVTWTKCDGSMYHFHYVSLSTVILCI